MEGPIAIIDMTLVCELAFIPLKDSNHYTERVKVGMTEFDGIVEGNVKKGYFVDLDTCFDIIIKFSKRPVQGYLVMLDMLDPDNGTNRFF